MSYPSPAEIDRYRKAKKENAPFDEAELELEDVQEQADLVGKLTPRDYALLRGMTPQLVYYFIRNKVIEVEYCQCGRKVVDVRASDQALSEKKSKRRGSVGTKDTDGDQR